MSKLEQFDKAEINALKKLKEMGFNFGDILTDYPDDLPTFVMVLENYIALQSSLEASQQRVTELEEAGLKINKVFEGMKGFGNVCLADGDYKNLNDALYVFQAITQPEGK